MGTHAKEHAAEGEAGDKQKRRNAFSIENNATRNREAHGVRKKEVTVSSLLLHSGRVRLRR